MAKNIVKVKVSGLRELDKKLNDLDLELRKRAAREAGREAMKPVAERMKNKIPVDTGGLKDTIRVSATTAPSRLKKYSKKASMIASASVGRKSHKEGGTGHQALQLEFGTHRKHHMEAQPFVRPAIQGHEKTVFMHFRKHLNKSINKFARRNKNK